jgi:hypothetical protein
MARRLIVDLDMVVLLPVDDSTGQAECRSVF